MAASPEADRRAAVEMAIRIAAAAVITRRASVGDAVAGVAAAMAGLEPAAGMSPREFTAAARRARQRDMLAELQRVEVAGHGRDAIMIVAKKFAADPGDQIEIASLARWLRRHRGRRAA